MADSFVSGSQAGAIGGAENKPGLTGENTFEKKQVIQILYIVRYNPAAADGFNTDNLNAADSLVGSVTGAVQKATDAIEGAMDSIPGLNMFIKEKKTDSPSDKEYKYDYSEWDTGLSKIEAQLKEMEPKSATSTFEFSSTKPEDYKNEAEKLAQKIQSSLSPHSNYTVWLHLIGIGTGGNVINEFSSLLASDSKFNSEKKWMLKTMMYVGTSHYKDLNLFDKTALKNEGRRFNIYNNYDLTYHFINYFDNQDKLLQLIKDSNQNLLSLTVGKVKLRIVKILSLLLGGLNFSTDDMGDSLSKKFDNLKNEIKGLIDDCIELVKSVMDGMLGFIKLGELPEFSKMYQGLDRIPSEGIEIISNTIDTFVKKLENTTNEINVGPKDLVGILNGLCPLFDHLKDSLAVFNFKEKALAQLIDKVIEKAGVTQVYAYANASGADSIDVSIDDEYAKKIRDKYKDTGNVDQIGTYISSITNALKDVAQTKVAIASLAEEKKSTIADAIATTIRPMLISKQQVLQKLINWLNGIVDIKKLTEDITANKLMSYPSKALNGLVDFPPELNTSISNFDSELKRIYGYFEKKQYNVQEDTLHFIFNIHNNTLKSLNTRIQTIIGDQTHYTEFKKNNHQKDSGKAPDNVIVAHELPTK